MIGVGGWIMKIKRSAEIIFTIIFILILYFIGYKNPDYFDKIMLIIGTVAAVVGT